MLRRSVSWWVSPPKKLARRTSTIPIPCAPPAHCQGRQARAGLSMSIGRRVVITCYELGRTLEEAVDSARCQTRPPEEIVVVDDGSRDPYTRGALASLVRQGVKVIRLGTGPRTARNVGESSTAPLVVLLDADDLFEPTYLDRALRLLRNPDLSFVCCALQAFGRASYRWKPPPYSIAESIGRGACGQFRPSSAARSGRRSGASIRSTCQRTSISGSGRSSSASGPILDEALVRYRVRRGSRYHSAVVQGDYLRAKEMLLAKHERPPVPRRGCLRHPARLPARVERPRPLSGWRAARELSDEIALA